MSTLSRFPGGKGKENTSRIETNEVQTPTTSTGTLALTMSKAKTKVVVAALTGALTITANVGSGLADDAPPFVGDSLEILFSSDGVADHIVTFGTGFKTPGTLTVVSGKYGRASFTFNGSFWIGSGVATA